MANVTGLGCPRCGHALFVGNAGHTPVHGCGHCGGIWLDSAASKRAVENACQATIQLANQAAQHARADITPSPHGLACPVCGAAMRTERVANAWLDLDICDAHGVWYDKGELDRVARSMQRDVQDWRAVRVPFGAPGTGRARASVAVASSRSGSADGATDTAGCVVGGLLGDGLFALACLFDYDT